MSAEVCRPQPINRMDDEPKPLILQWVSLYLSGVGHWNNSLNDFLNTLSFTKRLNLATEGQSHRPIALFAYTFFSTLHRKQLGFPWNIFRSRWSSDTGRQAGRQTEEKRLLCLTLCNAFRRQHTRSEEASFLVGHPVKSIQWTQS